MFKTLLEKYSLSEKKRLESREAYFELKKNSLSRRGITLFSIFFFILYISIILLLEKKICFYLAYILISYIAALGVWAIIHPKVYKYVFNNELEECKLHVPIVEQFMMKYMGILLGLLYIFTSIIIFIFASGIKTSIYFPTLCNTNELLIMKNEMKQDTQECVDECRIKKLIAKKYDTNK